MDRLFNRVVFAARRKAPNCFRAPGVIRPRRSAGALICQWRRAPVTGRLHCAWSQQIEARDCDAKPRLRLAGWRARYEKPPE